MAYPGHFNSGHDPWTQNVPHVDETCPEGEPTRALVHFDIDPQNSEFKTALCIMCKCGY